MLRKIGLQQFVATIILMICMIPLYTTEAQCLRKPLNGADSFTQTNTGTNADDLILCEGTAEQATGRVSGEAGDDKILIVDSLPATAYDVYGDENGNAGNDLIIVDVGTIVGNVYGDLDLNGGFAGQDTIEIYGTADIVSGDFSEDTVVSETGGDDFIHIYGKVTSVYGDFLANTDASRDVGGDDTIVIHEGALVTRGVVGDRLNSSNTNSKNGDDTILIQGRVEHTVSGDGALAAPGGNDNITLTETGIIGVTGSTSRNIYGDGVDSIGGNDVIQIAGAVHGSVWGDWANAGGDDEIIITETGTIAANVEGDHINMDAKQNGSDRIVIFGRVEENVIGDGDQGISGADTILIGDSGTVEGDVLGDGTEKVTGSSKGSPDNITNQGKVMGNIAGDQTDGAGAGDIITTTANSVVAGSVYGDHITYKGNAGGWDKLLIGGNVKGDVIGDHVNGDGGADFIHVQYGSVVEGGIMGDDVKGSGAEDMIWVDGTVNKKVIGDGAVSGNKKDQISIRNTGLVKNTVAGDGSSSSANGGWDVINIFGQVNLHVLGDDVGGDGGNDFMAVRMNGVVKRDFVGDSASGNGGNDTLSLISGVVEGDMIGDDAGGNGGDDKLNVLVAGTVKGDVIGDKVGIDKVGGRDNIFVSGKVSGSIFGDHQVQNAFAGQDTIQVSPSAVIENGVWGDHAKGAGKNDSIKINGVITSGGVRGDGVLGKGGNDSIWIFGFGDVKGNVIGDDANNTGGDDLIQVAIGGKVQGHVWGDYSKGDGGNDEIKIAGLVTGNVEGDHHKSGSTANGGNDTIVIEVNGVVQGDVFGDNSPGNGGNDRIDIKGTVNGNVLGDHVGGAGGKDVIQVFAGGVVSGSVCGFNLCSNNPDDTVVFLDENINAELDNADTIIIAGEVLGDVIAGTFYGSHSDDTIIVVEGAEIGGTVYGGDENNGDSFVYIESIINEEKTSNDVADSVTETNGKITVNGVTYVLDDIEFVSGVVGQIACFGMEYRMNKASDGCSARSGAEKEAIQWHRDNPGNDGRLPGLEGCAVYPYGDAMRIYQIGHGTEGELVAEIWHDILGDVPASNELLGQTAEGNIKLYHLVSGELQIECKNFVDGKTQVRVLSDLAGTVVNAYDKQ